MTRQEAAIQGLEFAIKSIKTKTKHDIINGYGDMTTILQESTRELCDQTIEPDIDDCDGDNDYAYSIDAERNTSTALAMSLATIVGLAFADDVTYNSAAANERVVSHGAVELNAQDHEVGTVEIDEIVLLFDGNYQCSVDGCESGVVEPGDLCQNCIENMSFSDLQAMRIQEVIK